MFKYDVHEIIRRARARPISWKIDGKLTYRKLFLLTIASCLLFLWILTRYFGNHEIAKGKESRGIFIQLLN